LINCKEMSPGKGKSDLRRPWKKLVTSVEQREGGRCPVTGGGGVEVSTKVPSQRHTSAGKEELGKLIRPSPLNQKRGRVSRKRGISKRETTKNSGGVSKESEEIKSGANGITPVYPRGGNAPGDARRFSPGAR